MASRRPSASPASPDSLPSAPDPSASETEWEAVGTPAPRRIAGRGAVDDGVVEPLPAPWIWRVYAGFTAYLGLPIIAAWIGVAIAAVVFLPDFGATAGFGLVDLVPGNTPAVRAQALENRLFGSSFSDAQSVVVERDPKGIAPATLLGVGEQARAIDSSRPSSAPASRPVFALPLVSIPGLTPALGRPATTTVTYLFFKQAAEAGDIDAGSQRYAAAAPHPAGTTVGVTGSVPAQISEGDLIESSLLPLEIVTVLVIAILVALVFRSLIAPVVPLAGAGVAYLVTSHVLGWGARELAIQIPSQLSPIMVVLILGVVTDYSVFTLTGMRARLAAGERRTWALRHAASHVVPLVIAAALTVAAGTVALIGANLDFFHAVGPGMAVAVIISGLVSISFVPALAGVLGRVAFWPSLKVARATPVGARATLGAGRTRRLVATLLSRRWVAMVAVIVCLAGLVAMGSGVTMARFGTNVVSGLPGTSGPRQAATAAAAGFGSGILAPTTLTLQARGVASKSAALARIGNVVRRSPGVAAVVGPEDLPATLDASLFRTANGNAVRFIVVFRDDPYDAGAIGAYDSLNPRVSAALSGAGLGGASATWSGATPTASESVASTEFDHLARRSAGCAADVPGPDPLLPRAARAPAPHRLERARGWRHRGTPRLRVSRSARVSGHHLLCADRRRRAAHLARCRLQRVRHGPHLGGGAWSHDDRGGDRRPSSSLSSGVDRGGDAGRELRGARHRARAAVPRVRVHHGRRRGHRRVPRAFTAPSRTAHPHRPCRVLASPHRPAFPGIATESAIVPASF